MVLSCVSSVWPQCGPETLGGALVPRRWIWVSVCPLDSMAFCVVLGIEFRASCMLGKPWSQIPAAIGMYLKGFKQNDLACEHRDSQSWRGVFYPAPRAALALWDFPRPAFCVFRLYLWASPPASWFPRSLFCIWPFHPQLGEPTLFPDPIPGLGRGRLFLATHLLPVTPSHPCLPLVWPAGTQTENGHTWLSLLTSFLSECERLLSHGSVCRGCDVTCRLGMWPAVVALALPSRLSLSSISPRY